MVIIHKKIYKNQKQPHTIMKELLEELEILQARLKNAGGGKITITSETFDIRLGPEHE